MTILPLTYFGPISWWKLLSTSENVVFDIFENYIKQTYRNRCSILSANGLLNLTIPIKKPSDNHTPFKDIKVDNSQRWQQIHSKAVMSAYKASPYYDYYIDDIKHIWIKSYSFLLDVCLESLISISCISKTKLNYSLSDFYITSTVADKDYRKEKKFTEFVNKQLLLPYCQVFSDRFGFVNDLSILDNIFNWH